MITILEYALLSQEVYGYGKNKAQYRFFLDYMMKLKGWVRPPDSIPFQPMANANFYAELWIKKKKKEAVVVFRGSSTIDNFLEDIKSWYPNVVFNEHTDNKPQKYYRLANVYAHQFTAYCATATAQDCKFNRSAARKAICCTCQSSVFWGEGLLA